MERKIASFTVNHDTLVPGMYISRVDGDCVTYDLRLKYPNSEQQIAKVKMAEGIDNSALLLVPNFEDEYDGLIGPEPKRRPRPAKPVVPAKKPEDDPCRCRCPCPYDSQQF